MVVPLTTIEVVGWANTSEGSRPTLGGTGGGDGGGDGGGGHGGHGGHGGGDGGADGGGGLGGGGHGGGGDGGGGDGGSGGVWWHHVSLCSSTSLVLPSFTFISVPGLVHGGCSQFKNLTLNSKRTLSTRLSSYGVQQVSEHP